MIQVKRTHLARPGTRIQSAMWHAAADGPGLDQDQAAFTARAAWWVLVPRTRLAAHLARHVE
jgi:hypothetical protein